jgi:hypothetical protein
MIITVRFQDDTIKQIERTIPEADEKMHNPEAREKELNRIVENAMRVYLQLASIAKKRGTVTVIAGDEKYKIDLGYQ